MGLDLTLIPVDHGDADWGYGHQLLEFDSDRDLFYKIMDLTPQFPVPKKFSTFRSRNKDGTCYGETQDTPYGRPLTAVKVSQLKTVDIPGPIGAYINACPDDQLIALFWH